MATLDLTLDKMRFPGIENFNPEFGTKETTGRGVHSVNLSENDMMPFLLQRPVSVVENSSTGAIEADRKLAVEASGVTLTLGRPSYPGCKVTVYGSFSSGTATVVYDKDANDTASVVVGAGERVELEANALRYFEVKAPAMSELAVASGTLSQAKTIPLGYASDAKLAFKAVFPVGHNDATSADSLTLNGIAVVSNQNGTLAPIPHHAMAEGGSTVYKVLDPNTTLEMYYTADYDGNSTPAFVIIGNPVVLSSEDYTIYANGLKRVDEIQNGNLGMVTSNAVYDKFSLIGVQYYSNEVIVTETTWTKKTFTFTDIVPHGRYLISFLITARAADGVVGVDYLSQMVSYRDVGKPIIFGGVRTFSSDKSSIDFMAAQNNIGTAKVQVYLIRLI